MIEKTFCYPQSGTFWQGCKAVMPPVRLQIILEVLRVLDELGSVSSVRSNYPSQGQYGLQGKVCLLDHSINVATICRELCGVGDFGDLAVIAGLSHDCGKLPEIHRGDYTAAMHSHYGAAYLTDVVAGRLIDLQANAVVEAVRTHHIPIGSDLHKILRRADRLARESEHLQVVDALAQRNRLLLASPIKGNGCKGGTYE